MALILGDPGISPGPAYQCMHILGAAIMILKRHFSTQLSKIPGKMLVECVCLCVTIFQFLGLDLQLCMAKPCDACNHSICIRFYYST